MTRNLARGRSGRNWRRESANVGVLRPARLFRLCSGGAAAFGEGGEEGAEGGGGYGFDAGGGGEIGGAGAFQFFAEFGAEAADDGVVEIFGDFDRFVGGAGADFGVHAGQIAGVVQVGAEDVRGTRCGGAGVVVEGGDVGLQALEGALAFWADAAPGEAERGEAELSVVGAEQQAVFGAAGEHAVGLGDPLRDQVVDEDADIGLVAGEVDGGGAGGGAGGVEAGEETLGGGFLVAGGAVDLAGEEQAGHGAQLKAVVEGAGVDEIIFDGVAGAQDLGAFEAGDGVDELCLDVGGEAGGDAVGVDGVVIQAFGFQEDLVAGFVGEAGDFVLDRRAIARAAAGDVAGVDGGFFNIVGDDFVGGRRRVGDAAGNLTVRYFFCQGGKWLRRDFACVFLEVFPVDAALGEACRRAGFEAAEREIEGEEGVGEGGCRRVADAAAGLGDVAEVEDSAEEGAGGQDGGFAGVGGAVGGGDGGKGAVRVFGETRHLGFDDGEVGLGGEEALDGGAVEGAVGLGAGAADGGAFSAVEQFEMDAGGVGGFAHQAVQRVDLADQVAFADAADGGVAGHLA